jgi:cystathionine beta-lyase
MVQRELEAALCALEHAEHARLTSNGLQACALSIGSIVRSGDHVLIADCLYGPSRRFNLRRLSAMGVSATQFSARATMDELERLIQPNTKAIVVESPGSLTFEILDLPAIVKLAHAHKLLVVADNTWGAGLLHRPLDLGVDICVQALTKYAVGHSDSMGGAVLTNSKQLATRIANCSEDWGITLAPDDAYVALRGLRTLETRLKQHEAGAFEVANWLTMRSEVANVLHPGLPSHPDHALWQRDFSGANGLFGVVLQTISDAQLDAFLESLKLFKMGFSWGGYESLLIPCDEQLKRLPSDPIHNRPGPLLRLHVGLEAPEDLIAELDQAFSVMASTAP